MTATPGEVLSGYKFVGASTDDVQVGTLQLTGNAATNHVLSGTTFYTNNPKNKLTGYMAINNIRGFSVSLISGRNVTVQWTNPVQTAGYPYSGVYVKYQTGSYPTPSTGTQAYKGVGSSGASGAASTVFRNGVVLCSADGGKSNTSKTYDGGSGGSGGGGGGQRDGNIPGQWGGSNGAGGGSVAASGSGGRGQGFTTTAFRENWGTVYSGGGGGAGANTGSGGGGNAGGGGGGGAYGGGGWGSANTGGGGGGQYWPNGTNGGNGGSGVILIRIK